MDLTPTSTTTIPNTAATKSPEEHDTETPPPPPPPRIPNTVYTPKVLSFSNGVLKRHPPHTHHHHHHHHPLTTTNHPIQVTYKECLKNHAASLGGHALDGCGEFMPSPAATAADPTSIKCAACGCHRNFHRREPEEPPITAVIEFQPHHRHHPPPPPPPFPTVSRSPNSSSPPPISSSYYPSAPHMLLALSSGGGIAAAPENAAAATVGRKRFRTKFTQEQKEKMLRFAEKVGWKMQKRDEIWVHEFCNEIGVDRGVLKVWMHNNKNNFAKKEIGAATNGGVGGAKNILDGNINNTAINNKENDNNNNNDGPRDHYDGGVNVGANGSSSSS